MNWAPHPLLCLLRAGDQPLRRYVAELLVQEGYFATDCVELDRPADLTTLLDGRALVIVSAATLTADEVEVLVRYVTMGGRAIFIRPPAEVVEALGWTVIAKPHPIYGDAPPAYLRVADHPWAGNHAGALIQVHATVALWHLSGVNVLAHAAPNRTEHADSPAICEASCGAGLAAIFGFELGTSQVLTRQGDPRLASNSGFPRADHDIVKPGTLFFGHLDPELREVPQADVMADLLVGVIRGLTDDLLPLPRAWHLPADAPALTLVDGDSDSYDWDSYHGLVDPLEAAGIPYTLNLMPGHTAELDRPRAESAMARGHDFQLHYRYPGWKPTVEELAAAIPEQQRAFAEVFGRASIASRAHSVLWPGYVEPAELYAASGARMETNFMPFRGCQYGYCGSGRPGRFSRLDGSLIELSQQPTLLMDDPLSNDKAGLPARSAEFCQELVARLYAASVERYHGVICTCLHPVTNPRPQFRIVQDALRDAIIEATLHHGLPALTLQAWSDFHEARRGVDLRYGADGWTVSAPQPVPGLTIHTPAATGSRRAGWSWRAQQVDLAGGGSAPVD